jgi:ribokinase
MGDDAEAADVIERSHKFNIVANPRRAPGTVVDMARVVVVGSANVDLVWQGEQLPAPGETVTDGRFMEALGGKGANQAAAAAALGADVRFIGCVGDDAYGALVRADLVGRGIDAARLATVTEPTGIALIMVDGRGENAIAVAPGANRAVTSAMLDGAIERGDVVLCSCEIPIETVRAAVAVADAAGAHTIVNPAPARALIGGAILTPNDGECAQLGGIDALLQVAPYVIVTHGADGVTLHYAGGPTKHQPAFGVEVVDTTGAGDAFNGALAWALADGRRFEEAVRLAAAAGSLATRALGARAALPSAQEVLALATA